MCFLGVHTRKVGNSCSIVECTISIGEMSAAGIIMPRCACTSEVYTVVCLCVCV